MTFSVAEVADREGIRVRQVGSSVSCACPVCGAPRRHTKSGDPRGACALKGYQWHCWQCEAGGGSYDFASWARYRRGWSALSAPERDAVEALVRQQGEGHAWHQSDYQAKPLPPADEVADLWAACVRVDECPATSVWCHEYGLSATGIADHDLARALPSSGALPGWARLGARNWREAGYRLLVPLYDAHGELRNLLARKVTAERGPKSVAAKGFGRSGLVMACPLVRQVLQAAAMPEWWEGDAELWVMEGEGDYLARALSVTDADEHAPMAMGIVSGSAKAEVFARIPDGMRVMIATDDDPAGDAYADKIVRVMFERAQAGLVELLRWRPEVAA